MIYDIVDARHRLKRTSKVKTQKVDAKRSDWEIAYYGFFGEVAVARCLGIEPDKSVLIGGDGGTDIVFQGQRLQIKTPISHKTKNLLYFNNEHHFNAACSYAILCNIDEYETSVIVRGFISRKRFMDECGTHYLGYGHRIAVPAEQLLPMDSLIEKAQSSLNVQIGEPC